MSEQERLKERQTVHVSTLHSWLRTMAIAVLQQGSLDQDEESV